MGQSQYGSTSQTEKNTLRKQYVPVLIPGTVAWLPIPGSKFHKKGFARFF